MYVYVHNYSIDIYVSIYVHTYVYVYPIQEAKHFDLISVCRFFCSLQMIFIYLNHFELMLLFRW